jgi:hypothetical protein
MKNNTMKCSSIWIGIALACASTVTFAAESHMAEALKHAEAATKASDGKTVAEHADAAKTHAAVVSEHLTAGLKSLNDTIDHSKMGHDDMAKKSAEEAVTHLKAAQ